MIRTIPFVAAGLLVGVATVAGAQTRAQAFSDEVAQMQGISSSGPEYHVRPALTSHADDPLDRTSFGDTFARMQAQSSNSGKFRRAAPQPGIQPADPVGAQSFRDTFERMQAESSSSGEFAMVSASALSGAAAGGATLANAGHDTQMLAAAGAPVVVAPKSR